MDSQAVSKAIREVIRPLLKDKGFTKFTGRFAWRFSENAIEIINFQSLNSYAAFGVGCTTYSFSINLGIFYKSVEQTPWFVSVPAKLPKEHPSHVKKELHKHLNQAKLFHPYSDSSFHAWKKDRKEIWYVLEDGSNLNEAIADAKEAVIKDGFPWFTKMTNLSLALEELEKEGKDAMSWHNAEIMSALAIQLEDITKAIKAYDKLLNNPFYLKLHDNSKNAKAVSDDYYEVAQQRIKLLKTL